MALANLDIGVTVDSSSAVAGFNATAAATARFSRTTTSAFNSANAAAQQYQHTLGNTREMRAAAGAAGNLAAQLQDIGIVAAAGQNPLTVMLQQGSQIAAVFGQAGAAGGIKALGSALLGLVNPVSLLVIGFTGLLTVGIQYFIGLFDHSKDAEAALKRHEATLKEIQTLWPELTKAPDEYNRKVREILAAAGGRSAVAEQLTTITEEAKKLAATLSEQQGLGQLGELLNQAEVEPFRSAIEGLVSGGSLTEFEAQVIAINEGLAAQGKFLPGVGAMVSKAGRDFAAAGANTKELRDAIADFAVMVQTDPVAAVETLTVRLEAMRQKFGDTSAIGTQVNAIYTLLEPLGDLVTKYQETEGAATGANAAIAGTDAAARQAAAGLTTLLGNLSNYEAAMNRLREGVPLMTGFQQAKKDYEDAATAAKGGLHPIEDLIKADAAYKAKLATLPSFGPPVQQFWQAQETAANKAAGAAKTAGAALAKTAEQNQQWVQSLLDAADPTLAIQRDIDRLNQLYPEGTRGAQEYAIAIGVLNKRMTEAAKGSKTQFDLAKTFSQMMQSWGATVASSFADAIVNGDSLEDTFKSLIKQLTKMALEMLVLKPLMEAVMGGFSGGGGGSSFMGDFLGNLGKSASPATYYNPLGRAGAAPLQGTGSSRTITSNATSVGAMTINIGGGAGDSGVAAQDERTRRMGKQIRDAVTEVIAREQRAGGLLWAR